MHTQQNTNSYTGKGSAAAREDFVELIKESGTEHGVRRIYQPISLFINRSRQSSLIYFSPRISAQHCESQLLPKEEILARSQPTAPTMGL
jgi:hypothetical protein